MEHHDDPTLAGGLASHSKNCFNLGRVVGVIVDDAHPVFDSDRFESALRACEAAESLGHRRGLDPKIHPNAPRPYGVEEVVQTRHVQRERIGAAVGVDQRLARDRSRVGDLDAYVGTQLRAVGAYASTGGSCCLGEAPRTVIIRARDEETAVNNIFREVDKRLLDCFDAAVVKQVVGFDVGDQSDAGGVVEE